MIPTPRLAALLALCAVAAVPAGWRVAAVAAAAAVAASIADALRARRAPRVERAHPPVVARGQPVDLSVEVRAEGPVRVRQALPADVALEPQEADGDLAGRLVALRRGRHVLPPVGVRATGPLGLGAWLHRAGGDAELLVYPDLVGARRLAEAASARPAAGRGPPVARRLRPRNGVRGGARVRPGRRRPADQLARDRAARATDVRTSTASTRTARCAACSTPAG